VDTLLAGRLVEVTGEVPLSRITAAGVTSSPDPDTAAVLGETNMEAARTAGLKTALTVANKAATVNPTTSRTETRRVDMDDRTTPLEDTHKAAMVSLTTNRTETPRADMGDRTTPLEDTNKAATVDPTTNRTKTPRADTGDRPTPLEDTNKARMVNLTTSRTKTPRATTGDRETPMVDRKRPMEVILTEAKPPVTADRMTPLTEAIRKAMVDLVITPLVPMANRRNAAVDMVVPEEVTVLNGTTTTSLMTPAAIVRDTNPRISRRRTLTPPATPPHLVTPIPPGEVMVEVVRRKAGTTHPAATGEATSLMAAKN